jgi:hypothetical protein
MITAEQISSLPLIVNLYDDSTLVATGTLSNLLYPASLPLKENSSSNNKKDSNSVIIKELRKKEFNVN